MFMLLSLLLSIDSFFSLSRFLFLYSLSLSHVLLFFSLAVWRSLTLSLSISLALPLFLSSQDTDNTPFAPSQTDILTVWSNYFSADMSLGAECSGGGLVPKLPLWGSELRRHQIRRGSEFCLNSLMHSVKVLEEDPYTWISRSRRECDRQLLA